MPTRLRTPLAAALLVAALLAAGGTAVSEDKGAAPPAPKEDLRSLPDEEKLKRLKATEKEYEDYSRNQDLVPVRTRRNGVTRMGDMRYPPAAKFLRKAFEQDNDLTTRIAALIAIGKCGDMETIEFAVKRSLSVAAKQPVFAASLPRMFAQVENQDARVWITTRLPDKEDDVAADVVEAMGEARVPEAVPVLTGILQKSKHPAVRFEALRALGKCGGKDACPKLLPHLADPDWRMRMGAVEGLGFANDPGMIPDIRKVMVKTEEAIVVETAIEALCRLGTRDAISPLIESLKIGRLRARQKARAGLRALAKSLFKSEKDYNVDPNLWKTWWDKVQKGIDPDDPTAARHETTSYFNFPVQSDRCFFILDVSGSMKWPDAPRESGIRPSDWKERRIDIAHRNLFKVLRDLAAQNRGRISKSKKGETADIPWAPVDGLEPPTLFNVAVFSGGVRGWQKSAVLADDEHVAEAIKWIEGILPGGGTASYDALAYGLAQTDIDTVFFLSDGVPSLGKYEERETILGELRKLNRFKRITINTIALIIGLSPIESVRKYEDPDDMADFMRRVAEENQGTFANESK
jgi:HEAT repeat protein